MGGDKKNVTWRGQPCGWVTDDNLVIQVIFERHRTGFEETKDYTPPVNTIIAGRYQVQDYLGTAVFSTAIQCLDLETVTEDNPVSHGSISY